MTTTYIPFLNRLFDTCCFGLSSSRGLLPDVMPSSRGTSSSSSSSALCRVLRVFLGIDYSKISIELEAKERQLSYVLFFAYKSTGWLDVREMKSAGGGPSFLLYVPCLIK
jgi:hypothetical protein